MLRKMRRRRYLFWLLCWGMVSSVHAQDDATPSNFSVNGYLKYLNTVQFAEWDGEWFTDNILHNRINTRWYPSGGSVTLALEVRNRIFYGETVKSFPGYDQLVAQNNGWVDLSFLPFSSKSVFMHTVVDRLYADWSQGNWQVRLGRQRLNWGQSFVWNPNDIFNAYSFFDFDYEERPGSDALLVQYFTGVTSSVQVAAATLGTWETATLAALFRWNVHGYDFQTLTGKMREDWVWCIGWSGNLKTWGFRGEMTYFRNLEALGNDAGTFVGDVSFDYTFPNATFVHTELIYNSRPQGQAFALGALNPEPLTAKTLTNTHWNVFVEANFQCTPLIQAGMATIVSPDDWSYFLGPSATVSFTNNLDFLALAQVFDAGNTLDAQGTLLFTRLKWSF